MPKSNARTAPAVTPTHTPAADAAETINAAPDVATPAPGDTLAAVAESMARHGLPVGGIAVGLLELSTWTTAGEITPEEADRLAVEAVAAEEARRAALAVVGWPEGFAPSPTYYGDEGPTQLAAFLDAMRGGPNRDAFTAPASHALLNGEYKDALSWIVGTAQAAERVEGGGETFARFAALFSHGPVLDFIHDTYGLAVPHVTERPALLFLHTGGGEAVRTSDKGTLTRHTCALSGVKFYTPHGAAVPVLQARRPLVPEEEGEEMQLTQTYVVHPALVDAGPAAVSRALLCAMNKAANAAAEALADAAELAAMVAAMPPEGPATGWPVRLYREITEEQGPDGQYVPVPVQVGYWSKAG